MSEDFIGCHFCGKPTGEVRQLIAGPNTFICGECVFLCCNLIIDGWKVKMKQLEEAGQHEELLK